MVDEEPRTKEHTDKTIPSWSEVKELLKEDIKVYSSMISIEDLLNND